MTCLPETGAAREILCGPSKWAQVVKGGIINTAFRAKMSPETRQNNLAKRIPLAREGTADQVAQLVCELIANDYITAETVSIDGGLTVRIC